MNNLFVVKWGTAYDDKYVDVLYNSAKRHSQTPFDFYVLTDSMPNANPEYKIIQLPDWGLTTKNAWWYKMFLFSLGIHGRNLYIDLDTVICDNITKFWNYERGAEFIICQDFNRAYLPGYNKCNSSVMAWTGGNMQSKYNDFMRDKAMMIAKHRGDQDYLEGVWPRSFWPKNWAMSYKWELWRGGKTSNLDTSYRQKELAVVIPSECSIAVFHGKPKPHTLDDPFITANWI